MNGRPGPLRQTTTAEVRLDEGKPPSYSPAWPSVSAFWLSAGRLRSNFVAAGTPRDGRSHPTSRESGECRIKARLRMQAMEDHIYLGWPVSDCTDAMAARFCSDHAVALPGVGTVADDVARMWKALLLFVLIISSAPAFGQTCGPDAAPPQAAAAGYICETFRWGIGDTISKIDTAQTYAPGFKWYYSTAALNGHATVGSDFTVTSGGKIVTQTSVPADHGAFVLNTCGVPSPGTLWTVGQYFTRGWYLEFVGEWNATGFFGIQTGFYGLDQYTPGPFTWEVDNPDAFAFDQAVADWHGGTAGVQATTGKTFRSNGGNRRQPVWGYVNRNRFYILDQRYS
jgi:hypothetical protein